MSVSAHLTEMYFSKYKWMKLNFRWLVVGCYFPDGMGMSKVLLLATGNPIFHRDILFGWTHSLPVCGMFALAIGSYFGRWAGWSFAFAAWLHTFMDMGDPLGVKLFFPLLDQKYSLGIWPWTDHSIIQDMMAYYTHPVSFTIEFACLVGAFYAAKKLTGTYNPIKATMVMFGRDGWFDKVEEVKAKRKTAKSKQPSQLGLAHRFASWML